jgi:poly [ADP-ribose] polymerase
LWLIESDEAKKPLAESKYSSFTQINQASQADENTDTKAVDGSESVPADNKRVTRKRGVVVASAENDAEETTNTKKNGANGKAKPSLDAKPTIKNEDVDDDPAENDTDTKTKVTKKTGVKGKAKNAEDKKVAGKKRGADEDTVESGANKKTKDIQKTATKAINVPIDEGVHGLGNPAGKSTIQQLMRRDKLTRFVTDLKVYIDDSGLIWDATLSQTVAANNANKFYRVQLLFCAKKGYFTWTRWGRVGEHGQSSWLGDGLLENAIHHYEKKFKDKSGLKWENRLDNPRKGKYTFLERNYEDDGEEEEPVKKEKTIKEEDDEPPAQSALSTGLQNLMAFIFNRQNVLDTLAAMSYDANKLPLGKLSDRTLKSGFLVLKEISEIMTTPTLAQERHGQTFDDAIDALSNRYFTLIPHVFGRHRPPTLNTNAQIKKEIELLEALTDMDVANEIMVSSKQDNDIHPLDRQFQSLGMKEMTEREYIAWSPKYITKLTSPSGSQINRVHRTRELPPELTWRDTQHDLQGSEHLPHRAPR